MKSPTGLDSHFLTSTLTEQDACWAFDILPQGYWGRPYPQSWKTPDMFSSLPAVVEELRCPVTAKVSKRKVVQSSAQSIWLNLSPSG